MTADLARRLAAGPAHFPHSLDLATDRLLLIETTEAELSAASFLDQRLVTPATKGAWAAMTDVVATVDRAARDDAHYIFHIGHVGSTLVSRLLGLLPNILSLREPLVLRGLAEVLGKRKAVDMPWPPEDTDARVATLRRLLARTFRAEQRTIVKATSFTSEIASELVAPGARALLLFTSPESYMQTILGGEASRQELAMLTGPRLLRLAHHIDRMPYRAWSLDEGERVGLAWATETLSLGAAADRLPHDAVLWLDFDTFLTDPASALTRIAAHFGIALSPADAARIANDPVMQRYSKAPEHGYTADLRRQVKAQAAREHRDALAKGMAWLDSLSQNEAKVARARARARKG